MILLIWNMNYKANFASAKSPLPLFAKEGDLFRGLLAASGRIKSKITHEKHLN